MAQMGNGNFERQFRDLPEDSPEKIAIYEARRLKNEREMKAAEYKNKLVNRLLLLLHPAGRVNRSKLAGKNNKQLIAVGKAAAVLYEEMDKAGLVDHGGVIRENNRNF